MLAHELDDAVTWGPGPKARRRFGDLETSIHASVNVGAAHLLAGDPAGVGELRERMSGPRRPGSPFAATRALICIAAFQQRAWRFDAAAPVLDEALAYASANDLDGYVQYCSASGPRSGSSAATGRRPSPTATTRWAGRPAAVSPCRALDRPGADLAARGSAEALDTLDIAAMYASGTDEVQRIEPVAAARAEYFTLAGDGRRAAEEARRGLLLARAKGHPHQQPSWPTGWRATGENDEPATGSTPYHLLMRGDWATAATAWAALGSRYAPGR